MREPAGGWVQDGEKRSYEIIDIEEKQSPGFDSYATTGENEGINERIQRNVDQKTPLKYNLPPFPSNSTPPPAHKTEESSLGVAFKKNLRVVIRPETLSVWVEHKGCKSEWFLIDSKD